MNGLKACLQELRFDAKNVTGVNPKLRKTTIPFIFPNPDGAAFKRLRKRFDFNETIQGLDEFQAQLELAKWVDAHIFRSDDVAATNDPLQVLELSAKKTVGFWCAHFGLVYAACANAAGFLARHLGVDSLHEAHENSTHHGTNEIYSTVFRKWYLIDSMHGCVYFKNETPLNAYEIAEEWLANQGQDVKIFDFHKNAVIDKSHKRVVNNKHESSAYFFFYTDVVMDPFLKNGDAFPHRQLFFEDEKRKKHVWLQGPAGKSRPHGGYSGAFLHTDRIDDFYFDANTVHITTRPVTATRDIALSFETLTPNLSHFLHRLNDGAWRELPNSLKWNKRRGGYSKKDGNGPSFPDVLPNEIRWKINRPGQYSVKVKPVNRLGREGAVSSLSFMLK